MAFIPAIPLVLEGAEFIIAAVEAGEVIEGTALAGEAAAAGGTAVAEGAAGGAVVVEGGGAAAAAGAQAGGAAQLSLLRTAVQASQWVARQIAEFEAFDLGMQAVEKAISKLHEITKSPETKEMEDIAHKCNEAIKLLDAALKDWSIWMSDNFDKKVSFGTIQVPGVSLLRFDILMNRLGTLVDIRQKHVSSAGITASKTPMVNNFRALLRAVQSYGIEMGKLSEELMQPGTPLANGGLNGHKADIQTAQQTLV